MKGKKKIVPKNNVSFPEKKMTKKFGATTLSMTTFSLTPLGK
jgi:hypothetical protein